MRRRSKLWLISLTPQWTENVAFNDLCKKYHCKFVLTVVDVFHIQMNAGHENPHSLWTLVAQKLHYLRDKTEGCEQQGCTRPKKTDVNPPFTMTCKQTHTFTSSRQHIQTTHLIKDWKHKTETSLFFVIFCGRKPKTIPPQTWGNLSDVWLNYDD